MSGPVNEMIPGLHQSDIFKISINFHVNGQTETGLDLKTYFTLRSAMLDKYLRKVFEYFFTIEMRILSTFKMHFRSICICFSNFFDYKYFWYDCKHLHFGINS